MRAASDFRLEGRRGKEQGIATMPSAFLAATGSSERYFEATAEVHARAEAAGSDAVDEAFDLQLVADVVADAGRPFFARHRRPQSPR